MTMIQEATTKIQTKHSRSSSIRSWIKKKDEASTIQLSEEDMDYIASNTAISRENIEQQFKVFITNHPDGKISKKSFKTMMKACYPGANVEKLTKHIWRMYDSNNDGSIDFRELMMVIYLVFISLGFCLYFFLLNLQVLYIMSDGTPEQNLKQIFKIFDLNNDGKINLEEMNKITKDLSKLFDDDKNMAENIFKEMDENKDGEISEEEFIKACLSQKKCSKRFTLKIIDIFLQ